ncbi:ATP-binding protein [Roseisolibacter sp. H3M3-2]|uniref:sensor histidine kinase n=1 Tax=Roseisolibacter sp. H3M3-2 TaxID=3031323 RepID=UPI0023DB621C|nr:ATP-binding protein [Roseisolibacter sp. H3M3-2]MDF1505780.1 ATP-binding protein [Roseisolibacter sp. H3M3-2]
MAESVRRTVALAVASWLLFLGLVGGAAYQSMRRLLDTTTAQEDAQRALRALEATYSDVATAESAVRGYILTGEARYLQQFQDERRSAEARLDLLTAAPDGPAAGAAARAEALRPLVRRRLNYLRETLDRRRDGTESALAVMRAPVVRALADSIRAGVDAAGLEQEELVRAQSDGQRAWVRQVGGSIFLSLATALAAGLLVLNVIRRDLAGRAAAAHALRDAKESAEAANRAKSDFLARMSHELRTPLNSVIGFSNVLLRMRTVELGEDGRTYLERVRDNGMHLLRMIDDLLDIARIEVGRIAIDARTVALDQLVRDVLAAFEEDARRRGLGLYAELPDAPARLQADPARLRQVLVNLVGNALRFTRRGSVSIRVVVDPATGAPARIDVVDTGIGIPPERQQAIFDAFEQADTSTAREFGGTGLGLAISRSLCELMGFELALVSTPGVGSTFSVLLSPAAAPAEAPALAVG